VISFLNFRIFAGLAFLLGLIVISSKSHAQEFSTESKRAIKFYEEGNKKFILLDYLAAEGNLNKAILTDNKFIEAYLLLGDVYREQKKYSEANDVYDKVIALNSKKYPEVWYFSAVSFYEIQNYQLASRRFKKFLSFPDVGTSRAEEAAFLHACCIFAIEAIKNPVPFKPVNLGKNINSKNHEYINSVSSDELQLYFTRRDSLANANRGGEDFYFSNRKNINNEWNISVKMGPTINTDGDEGALTISPDGRFLLFAGCHRADGFGSCDIYAARLTGNSVSSPINLGPVLNSAKWETQPSLSSDGRTLYFTSTRAGGFGKSDIWKSTLQDNGDWSIPENPGELINTKGSEMSPFIHPDGQTLYFSSDRHVGMGGIDLFVSRLDSAGDWMEPVNLGYPINTAADEMNIVVNAAGDKAFISSNQLSGSGGYDIFEFEVPQKIRPVSSTYIKGIVSNSKTRKPLEAYFSLTDLLTGKEVVRSFSDQTSGEFLVCLPTNREYALNVSKNGYLFHSLNFSLTGLNSQITPYIIDIFLEPVGEGETMVLRNIFFETAKSELKPESKVELEKLIEFLNSNPKIVIEISGHTDNIGSEDFNQQLSSNRAKAVFDYLIQNKIESSRLTYKGYGFLQPLQSNETEEGRSQNRRTEIKILQIANPH
jgi:outer membrane protein OmpA-like peptidoglycan-associated protein